MKNDIISRQWILVIFLIQIHLYMTELFSFKSAEEANKKLDSLGGYRDPELVVPLKGASAHEVAVGPVHAGVIEPGHFRFMCQGEKVYNLEIMLGYQHKNTEELILKKNKTAINFFIIKTFL